jgi:starch-binding outer membrane protein, SusD/RagB family
MVPDWGSKFFASMEAMMLVKRTPTKAVPQAILLLLVLLAPVGCSFDVTNPGPTEDRFLDNPSSFAALVVGVERQWAVSLSDLAWIAATVTRENVGVRDLSNVRAGEVRPIDVNAVYGGLHSARWMAEDAIRRITTVVGQEAAAKDVNILGARIWAGYTNRTLGDVFCYAVFDRGPLQPSMVHYTRAEEHFTVAIAMATSLNNTVMLQRALAGRAQTRLMMGKYAEAAADAALVPRTFKFEQPYSVNDSDALWNDFVYYNNMQPYRRSTVSGTYWEDYFRQSGDPRTAWGSDTAFPKTEVLDLPWYFETKYGRTQANVTKPIRIATGYEMALIIAENHLRTGNRAQAVAVMNQRRTELNLPQLVAATDAEAWTHLKLERFREMWLEARAVGDHRRYAAEKTPGPLPALLDQAAAGRSLCWPLSEAEIASNPNAR